MIRIRKFLIATTALVVLGVAVLIIAGPAIQRAIFYPTPRNLPVVVSQTTDDLLVRLQVVLETNAPMVAKSLRPGLTDAQILALEKQGGFHLSEDLKSLYRWHNGMEITNTFGLLPGECWFPLDELVREQTFERQQLQAASLAQRVAYAILVGYRKKWVHILDDGAGDGYFYDAERSDGAGAFFHHMAEGGDYEWFPSLRNFLAGTIECYESKAFKTAVINGKLGLQEDAEQTQKIWRRVAKSSDGGN